MLSCRAECDDSEQVDRKLLSTVRQEQAHYYMPHRQRDYPRASPLLHGVWIWSTWTLTFFQRRVLPLLLLAVAATIDARGGRERGDPHAEGWTPLHDGCLRRDP